MSYKLLQGDCIEVLRTLPDGSVDAIVTDPPYGLEFMGKDWDAPWKSGGWQSGGGFSKPGIGDRPTAWPSFSATSKFGAANPTCGTCGGRARGKKRCECAEPQWKPIGKRRNPENEGLPDDVTSGINSHLRVFQDWCEAWATECLRVLKPGGHLLSFGGTRTYHRMACAIEDAGFEVRDSIHWIYGCLSEDTEILIDGEWVRYSKATEGSLALCYDAAHDTYAWLPIQQLYVYDYDDTAYRIESADTDQIVSRNHRCLVQRNGRWEFAVAEKVAREQEARVPVLEALPSLLDALRVSQPNASSTESLLRVLLGDSATSAANEEAERAAHRDDASEVRGVRNGSVEAEGVDSEGGATDLLSAVQRSASGRGVGATRAQGPQGVDGSESGSVPEEDVRGEQSGVEERRDLQAGQGELHRAEIRSLPSRVRSDGAEGRLRHGASTGGGDSVGALLDADGSGASHRPQHAEQLAVEPHAVRHESGTQAVRGEGFTGSTLARVTPFHLTGKVWCVKVPTGAFVARRNNKVFVTGNSGFPKSLDVSKAIDKAAGATRTEVVGRGRAGAAFHYGNPGEGGFGQTADKLGGVPSTQWDITAPATDAAKQWEGWGTALKPSHEPIIVARKPLVGTVAANVQQYGTGALNIDECRVAGAKPATTRGAGGQNGRYGPISAQGRIEDDGMGRWPPNLLLTHAPECAEACAEDCPVAEMDKQSGILRGPGGYCDTSRPLGGHAWNTMSKRSGQQYPGEVGGASRFFPVFKYQAKPARKEREAGLDHLPEKTVSSMSGRREADRMDEFKTDNDVTGRFVKQAKNIHPTVKPVALMEWLITLVTPPNGTVLDPFTGSGTTGVAALNLNRTFIGIEREPSYVPIAEARLQAALPKPPPPPEPSLKTSSKKSKKSQKDKPAKTNAAKAKPAKEPPQPDPNQLALFVPPTPSSK